MSPKKRTRLTPDERIGQILDAAERVFGDSGFRQGSIKEVADAVGLSVQGVLHYFGTKEKLLLATLDRRNAAQAEFGERIREEEGAIAYMRFYLAQNESHPGFRRLFVTLASEATSPDHPAHDYFVERYARTWERLSALLVEDVRAGRIRPSADPGEVAAAVIALSDGLQLQKLMRPGLDVLHSFDAAVESYRLA